MFKLHSQKELDPQNMTIADVTKVIRWRYPFTGRLEFVRQSANMTFKSRSYIFKVPITPRAINFAAFEAEIANLLPLDSIVEFPRIRYSAKPLPISRYKIIPGAPLPKSTPGKIFYPRELPNILGKSIALLHSCSFQGRLREALDQQRVDFYLRMRRQLEHETHIRRQSSAMPDIDISLLDDMISGHFDHARLVFCHGDIRSGNIILSENSPGKIGIIDFGNACYNARESDFAAIWQSQLRGEVAEAYEKHSGHVLDAELIEKFSTLHGALRLARARKRVNDRQGPRL